MRFLLSLLQEMGGDLSDVRLKALMVIVSRQILKTDGPYQFVFKNGGFHSFQLEEDKIQLERKIILERAPRWILSTTATRYAIELDFFEKIALRELKTKWLFKSDAALIELCTTLHQDRIFDDRASRFFTIGYEGVSPDSYINLLHANGIKLVVDVRKNAFSQKWGFSKSSLEQILIRSGIDYHHMPELGIESAKRHNLKSDADYRRLFKDYVAHTLNEQTRSLEDLCHMLDNKKRIAITCFEADPTQCHRYHVAEALRGRIPPESTIEHLISCSPEQKKIDKN